MIGGLSGAIFSNIPATHPTISLYRNSVHVLIAHLQENTTTWCLTLALRNDLPTVVALTQHVDSTPYGSDQWMTQTQDFTQLAEKTFGGELHGLMLQGNIGLATASDYSPGYFRKYSEKVKSGMSIGIEALPSHMGSFGGFMIDKHSKEIYGLTSAHNFAVNEPKDCHGDVLKLRELPAPGLKI